MMDAVNPRYPYQALRAVRSLEGAEKDILEALGTLKASSSDKTVVGRWRADLDTALAKIITARRILKKASYSYSRRTTP